MNKDNVRHIGIDPGKRGGISVVELAPGGFRILFAVGMPVRDDRLDCKRIATLLCSMRTPRILLEQPTTAMRSFQGGRIQSSTSIFSSGESFGRLCAILELYGLPYHLVEPRVWTKQLTQKLKGETSKDRALVAFQKLCSKDSQRWALPKRCRTLHDGIVDAALIAYYSLRFSQAS